MNLLDQAKNVEGSAAYVLVWCIEVKVLPLVDLLCYPNGVHYRARPVGKHRQETVVLHDFIESLGVVQEGPVKILIDTFLYGVLRDDLHGHLVDSSEGAKRMYKAQEFVTILPSKGLLRLVGGNERY